MKISIIGTGYVGLVTGACLAEAGNNVTCVDIDPKKIDNLNKGSIPIFEPGLESIVRENHKKNRLSFTTDLGKSINDSDICFIAVGTPPQEDGSADLTHVLDVAREIAQKSTKKIIVGTKSTVPVGTGDKIEEIFKQYLKHPYVVFSNPEFLKEGDAVHDFMKPDRIIIGLNDKSLKPLFEELYGPFMRQKEKLIFMSRRSSELTKYAANAMLATRISFMNEMANLCEKVNANIDDIRHGIGADPRIGSAFLFPGIGFGGSCFPKDVKAIQRTAVEHGVSLEVIHAASTANENQKKVLFDKIVKHYGGRDKLQGKKFAVWGLAFKAKTDDIRESPALALIDQLLDAESIITTYDPEATANVKMQYGDKLIYTSDAYVALKDTDALIIATEWNEFRSPDYNNLKANLKDKVIFDGRNLLNEVHTKEVGLSYYRIGKVS
ncbi:UDP-glucose/GDP-mannose dehydrogenase family protein [bacterium]|nr:UDP-glucose/GDP-mannose dehydrogenase family protein [bacterium]